MENPSTNNNTTKLREPENRELTLSEKLTGVIGTLEKNKLQAAERVERLKSSINMITVLQNSVETGKLSENEMKAVEHILAFGGLA